MTRKTWVTNNSNLQWQVFWCSCGGLPWFPTALHGRQNKAVWDQWRSSSSQLHLMGRTHRYLAEKKRNKQRMKEKWKWFMILRLELLWESSPWVLDRLIPVNCQFVIESFKGKLIIFDVVLLKQEKQGQWRSRGKRYNIQWIISHGIDYVSAVCSSCRVKLQAEHSWLNYTMTI